MVIWKPPLADGLGWLVGMEWPDGNEDLMWGLADDWRAAATSLSDIDSDIDTAIAAIRAAYPQGSGGEAMIKQLQAMRDGEGSVDELVKWFNSVAETADSTGTELEYTKLMFHSTLVLLALEIAAAWLFPPTAPATEAALIAGTRVGVRVMIRQLLSRIGQLGLKNSIAAALKSQFTKRLMIHMAIDGGMNAVPDAAIQGYQTMFGRRDKVDWGQVAVSGVSGAAGGMLGAGVGKAALGPMGKVFGDKMLGKRSMADRAAGALGGAANAMGAWAATGAMTGQWHFDPRMVTAGMVPGAMHGAGHGLGPGMRDAPSPLGKTNFDGGAMRPEGASPLSDGAAANPLSTPDDSGAPGQDVAPVGHDGGSGPVDRGGPPPAETRPAAADPGGSPDHSPPARAGDGSSRTDPGDQGYGRSTGERPAHDGVGERPVRDVGDEPSMHDGMGGQPVHDGPSDRAVQPDTGEQPAPYGSSATTPHDGPGVPPSGDGSTGRPPPPETVPGDNGSVTGKGEFGSAPRQGSGPDASVGDRGIGVTDPVSDSRPEAHDVPEPTPPSVDRPFVSPDTHPAGATPLGTEPVAARGDSPAAPPPDRTPPLGTDRPTDPAPFAPPPEPRPAANTPAARPDSTTPARPDTSTPARPVDASSPTRVGDTSNPARMADTSSPARPSDTSSSSRAGDTSGPARAGDAGSQARVGGDVGGPGRTVDPAGAERGRDSANAARAADGPSPARAGDASRTGLPGDAGPSGSPIHARSTGAEAAPRTHAGPESGSGTTPADRAGAGTERQGEHGGPRDRDSGAPGSPDRDAAPSGPRDHDPASAGPRDRDSASAGVRDRDAEPGGVRDRDTERSGTSPDREAPPKDSRDFDPQRDRPESHEPGSSEPRPSIEEAHARHGERTPAGISHHRGDTSMGDLPHRVPRDEGRFTADVHVTPDGHARIGNHRYTPEEYGNLLRNHGWDGKSPIRLIGCDAATNGFAARLATHLGVDVLAPTKSAWTDGRGRVYSSTPEIGPDGNRRPRIPPDGEWQTHRPNGTTTKVGDDGFVPGTRDADKQGLTPDDAAERARPVDPVRDDPDRDGTPQQRETWDPPVRPDGTPLPEVPLTVGRDVRVLDFKGREPLQPNSRMRVTDTDGNLRGVFYTDANRNVTHVETAVPNVGLSRDPIAAPVNPDTARPAPGVKYNVSTGPNLRHIFMGPEPTHDPLPAGREPDATAPPPHDSSLPSREPTHEPPQRFDEFNRGDVPPAVDWNPPGDHNGLYRTAEPVRNYDPATSGPFSLSEPREPHTRYDVYDTRGDWHGTFYTDARGNFSHIHTWSGNRDHGFNPELGTGATWDSGLQVPRPNTTYAVGPRYLDGFDAREPRQLYRTDEHGDTVAASIRPHYPPPGTRAADYFGSRRGFDETGNLQTDVGQIASGGNDRTGTRIDGEYDRDSQPPADRRMYRFAGGHLASYESGGPGERINHIPQWAYENSGWRLDERPTSDSWRRMESDQADLRADPNVDVDRIDVWAERRTPGVHTPDVLHAQFQLILRNPASIRVYLRSFYNVPEQARHPIYLHPPPPSP
ncbi:hypothetical protein [Nocardia wallacei]|uniref:WXG100-like domain-containing protein n=1 Tax=Nocardia wallacei TaxID=480035 RepID=UPI002454022E|nr:hypothetical protein [Nocardia wallacei]